MPVTKDVPANVPWARGISVDVLDARQPISVDSFPVHGRSVKGQLDLTNSPEVLTCNEQRDNPVNEAACTENGIVNACSLEDGCEALLVQLNISNPDLRNGLTFDGQLIAPNGENRFNLDFKISSNEANSYPSYHAIYFVGESQAEIWESGTYTIELTLEHEGDLTTATIEVPVDTGRHPQRASPTNPNPNGQPEPGSSRSSRQGPVPAWARNNHETAQTAAINPVTQPSEPTETVQTQRSQQTATGPATGPTTPAGNLLAGIDTTQVLSIVAASLIATVIASRM
jgi:hypothetical protein